MRWVEGVLVGRSVGRVVNWLVRMVVGMGVERVCLCVHGETQTEMQRPGYSDAEWYGSDPIGREAHVATAIVPEEGGDNPHFLLIFDFQYWCPDLPSILMPLCKDPLRVKGMRVGLGL